MTPLMFKLILGSVAYLANESNHTQNHTLNQTYQVVMEQYNTSNCSVPFHNFTYNFECPIEHNHTWCCAEEYEKLNTSFGSASCSQYEENDTFVHFLCREGSSASKSKKQNPYIMAGVAVAAIALSIAFITFLVWCMTRCQRSPYRRI